MIVPERIIVRVTCDYNADLSGLIVRMTVTAGLKTPYRILFPKTDGQGVAVLTRDDFVGQFKDHWEAGLMDHSGTPETASATVEVDLYDPSWSVKNRDMALAWPLLDHERTKWLSRTDEYSHRVSSRNLEFEATSILADLNVSTHIILPVRPVRVGTPTDGS
jgi:hypothetical protein